MAQKTERRTHRTKTEIAVCLLEVALDGAKKTHLVYKGILNHMIIVRHLDRLINQGLLAHDDTKYTTTPRGRQFLRRYHALMELIVK